MPNPHFQVQVIGRSMGRSSVAAAAYRAGANLTARRANGRRSILATAAYRSGQRLSDQQLGLTFNYQRKEHITHSEIVAPEHAPGWAREREALWNHVEVSEKRKDAQLARDLIAALPRELTREQNVALVRAFVTEQFVSRGMIADFSIHESDASDGEANPHVHIMLTMRDVGPEGFGKKNRAWNDLGHVAAWRAAWEAETNRRLEESGRPERVDLRSFEARGIDQEPGIHLGYGATNLERKGIETAPGDHNRAVTQQNELRMIVASWLPEPETAGWEENARGEDAPATPAQSAHRAALGDYLRTTLRASARAASAADLDALALARDPTSSLYCRSICTTLSCG